MAAPGAKTQSDPSRSFRPARTPFAGSSRFTSFRFSASPQATWAEPGPWHASHETLISEKVVR